MSLSLLFVHIQRILFLQIAAICIWNAGPWLSVLIFWLSYQFAKVCWFNEYAGQYLWSFGEVIFLNGGAGVNQMRCIVVSGKANIMIRIKTAWAVLTYIEPSTKESHHEAR